MPSLFYQCFPHQCDRMIERRAQHTVLPLLARKRACYMPPSMAVQRMQPVITLWHLPKLPYLSELRSGLYPTSPCLWLKLKSGWAAAAELRAVLGLGPPSAPANTASSSATTAGSPPHTTTSDEMPYRELGAVDLNRAALDWALSVAPPEARARLVPAGFCSFMLFEFGSVDGAWRVWTLGVLWRGSHDLHSEVCIRGCLTGNGGSTDC